MNSIKLNNLLSLMLITVLALFSSCKNDRQLDAKDEKLSMTDTFRTGEAMMKVNETETSSKSSSGMTNEDAMASRNNGTNQRVYKIADVDRIALFDASCLNNANPTKCSSEMLANYVKSKVEYPKKDLNRGNEGYEVITFTVNSDGSIAKTKYITSKGKECKQCQEEAMKVFDEMKYWVPAQKNGKNVSCEMVLPIRFGINS